MVIVGLCGPAGSGKTSVAKYLARAYGARVYAFAEPLKIIIQRAFELPDSCLWGTQAEKEAPIPGLGVSARFLMQRIGTNGIRSVFGDDFWVKNTMETVFAHRTRVAVIEDVRFLSEAAHMRESVSIPKRVHVWKLAHPWLEVTADPSHQSEAEWHLIQEDHTICPPVKSLDALYHAVDEACAKFGITPTLTSVEAP